MIKMKILSWRRLFFFFSLQDLHPVLYIGVVSVTSTFWGSSGDTSHLACFPPRRRIRLFSLSYFRFRWLPSATTVPGWSKRWPGLRNALTSSAACAPWAPPTSSPWPPTPPAATSCRPSSPHPVTKAGARSSRDWRYNMFAGFSVGLTQH